jgi:hypothetical protein
MSRFRSRVFLSGFPIKILYAFFFSLLRAIQKNTQISDHTGDVKEGWKNAHMRIIRNFNVFMENISVSKTANKIIVSRWSLF